MTATYRRETATHSNRLRQHKAETRIEEIVAVAGIERSYEDIDRACDLAVESQLGRLFQLVDNENERAEVTRTFVIWQRGERQEGLAVSVAVEGSVELLKSNNDLWLSDGCGPNGRAA